MEKNVKRIIHSLLSLNGVTITKLAELMTEKTGKKYTLASLSSKLKIKSLSLHEAYIIAEILDYDLEFTPKKKS
ncbi:unknown [Brachyspira sp. CAG:484]|nr:unknown [Brachyspira sp. CAG:484]